jgi:hypothetical protein
MSHKSFILHRNCVNIYIYIYRSSFNLYSLVYRNLQKTVLYVGIFFRVVSYNLMQIFHPHLTTDKVVTTKYIPQLTIQTKIGIWCSHSILCPEDGHSMLLGNVGTYLRDPMASHLRRNVL